MTTAPMISFGFLIFTRIGRRREWQSSSTSMVICPFEFINLKTSWRASYLDSPCWDSSSALRCVQCIWYAVYLVNLDLVQCLHMSFDEAMDVELAEGVG